MRCPFVVKGAVALALVAVVVGCDRSFRIVEGGRPVAEVVRTNHPLVDADIALFTNAVRLSTGGELPVVDRRTSGRRSIVFRIEERSLLAEDDWQMSFPDAKTLEICGSRHSCRWALNRILEENLGIVACWPGRHGTHYPRRSGLAFERVQRSGTASIKVERHLDGEDPAWERAMGGKEQRLNQFYNHNVWRIFPIEKYGKGEWREKLMPMKKGKRIVPVDKEMGWQPCYSAPEAVTEAVKNIRAYLDAHPEETVYSLTVNDSEGFCTCERCAKANGGRLDEKAKFGGGDKNRSRLYYTWANKVATELEKTHPNVMFGILAYYSTIDPPPFRLHRNLMPFLCFSIYQNHNPELWDRRLKLMKAWSEKTEAFGLWDYAYGCNSYVPPRIYMKTVSRFFKLKLSECPSFNGFFAEGNSLWGEGPKRWFYYRQAEDPSRDMDVELDRWYRACCGDEAAAALRRYYETWEAFWTGEAIRKTNWYKSIQSTYCDFNTLEFLTALEPDRVVRSGELMDEVVAAAERSGDADQRWRAASLRRWHEFYATKILKAQLEQPSTASGKSATEAARVVLAGLCRQSGVRTRLVTLAEEILKERMEDPWRYGAQTAASFRRRASSSQTLQTGLCTIAGGLDDAATRVEAERVTGDKSLDLPLRRAVAGLLRPFEGRRLVPALSATAASELEIWRACSSVDLKSLESVDGSLRYQVTGNGRWPSMTRVYAGLPGGECLKLTARIENCCKKALTMRFIVEGGGGESRIVKIAPGEKKLCVYPFQVKGSSLKGYIIFNGLEKGDVAIVDQVAVSGNPEL